MITLDRLYDLLRAANLHPRRGADGNIMALCPCHDDRRRSLSVTVRGGRVLVHCFAGCEPLSVLAALGVGRSTRAESSPSSQNRPNPLAYDPLRLSAVHAEWSLIVASDGDVRALRAREESLGIPPGGLSALGAVCYRDDAVACPMRNASGALIGVRFRAADGSKWAVRGSYEGLFITARRPREIAVVVEGMTDAAYMAGLGAPVVGRPSALSGQAMVVQALALVGEIVIVADDDEPGRRGARSLADALGERARVVVPPSKDVRASAPSDWRECFAWKLMDCEGR